MSRRPGIPSDNISDSHVNGHLVCTGKFDYEPQPRLYIHLSSAATSQHQCYCFSYNPDQNIIVGARKPKSARHVSHEHGWFRDVEIFKKICAAHPVPEGRTSQERFKKWRETLLEFLNANHSGGLWTQID